MFRQKRSYLWEYFTITDHSNGIAQCDICDRTLCFQSTASNLRKHLERKHPTILTNLAHSQSARASVSATSNDVPDNVCESDNVQDNQQSATSNDVCDNVCDGDNEQDNQQHVYSPTHTVDYESQEPVAYSLKIETVKGSTNQSDASAPVLVVAENEGVMPSMSTPPAVLSSVGGKRKWQESKNNGVPMVSHKQFSSPLKENDEFDIFGMSIAAKMRKISRINNTQCIIAEKLISEVLYHGQLQFLTFDTVIKLSD